ncbi:MAG TPA: sigma 54-interacting transcriptional regulator [Fimbriiglobus sp.]|nr:sigma 54-interacting transcriptional regulator [Fimbriiglobus sp.]
MAANPTGFLVQKLDDGFGDVYPLIPGQRHTVGRAPDNRIVLRDDLCSRYHAEVIEDAGGWAVRDLGSLNGSAVNDERVKREAPLRSMDTVRFGRSLMLFVQTLDQLPDLPPGPTKPPGHAEGLEITRRLGRTKYLAQPPAPPPEVTVNLGPGTADAPRGPTVAALAVLYRLALDMAEAHSAAELSEQAIDALLKATPAEVGAVLALKDGRELEPVAYRTQAESKATYHKVSQFVSQEVLSGKQAILAEDIARDAHLRNRESLAELRATSLICAPVLADGQTLGLVHLYRTGPGPRLNPEDLEFALAVAHQLGAVWHRLRRQAGLTLENQALRDQLRLESELVGRSESLKHVEEQVARVAATRATVLVRGESGVGKELVARAIHFNSPRKDGPFVTINCAALTETLLESELFGHEKGAFTGATERMIGKFEAADGGTIFLDEIGEMAAATQAKFLRVLEGQSFERVGGNTPIKVDVRVVAATNRPLEDAVRAGTFRKDLYFRLQVVQVDVPPLRERVEDVAAIADHFLRRFVRETGRKVKGFTPAALKKLEGYHWPGNVRELRNAIERAVALGNGSMIEESDIWLSPLEADGHLTPVEYEPVSLDELEKRHIIQTLEHTEWNKSQASAILGIERSTLDRKIKSYGLQK